MLTRIAVLAATLIMASASVIDESNGDISMNSEAGRELLQSSRKTQDEYYGNNYKVDDSFLSDYSMKFQGCHEVQEWNKYGEDEDMKIETQSLVRLRMCPADSCSSSSARGCDSNYGDYLVTMDTFIDSYMQHIQNANGGDRKLADIGDYMTCNEMQMDDGQRKRARQLEDSYNYTSSYNQAYYVGPYCAEQGSDIRIGVFSDDTCTSFASNGEKIFKMVNGFSLPYSDSSFVNLGCTSCGENGEVTEMCDTLYESSGKCETKMSVYYPNESSCSYIEGLKAARSDGSILSTSTRKSAGAAVATGLFLTASLLLAGYVYYLRTKLSRARINLNSSGHL